MTTKLPDASSLVVDENRRLTTPWRDALASVMRQLTSINSSLTDVDGSKASTDQTYAESAYIEYPTDKDYQFVAMGFDGTIEEVVTETESGTCTVTVLINDVALGDGSNAASTTRDTVAHTSANTLADGDDVTIQVSSNSAAVGLSVTLRGSRTLA